MPFEAQAQAELAGEPAFSSTTRTAGAISSTFIFTDTAALYMMIDAPQRSATSKPAGQVNKGDAAVFCKVHKPPYDPSMLQSRPKTFRCSSMAK